MLSRWLLILSPLLSFTTASYYDEAELDWNLNANPNAKRPLDYDIAPWPSGFQYQESPKNWRFPFYSFFLDRFVNGDPTNDNANGTAWEHDPYQTQLRAGGDIKGLADSLDYLQGLGIRGLYIAGSPMMNMPWESDSYSPLDHTILDHHFGRVQEWRDAIAAIHARGMYVILDNTMSTMSNLLSFDGYPNSSAPWSFTEHKMSYRGSRTYRDYEQSNHFEPVCDVPYPRFWDQAGELYHDNNTEAMIGCMDSDFDQYGVVSQFGQYPEWKKQLSKFGGVQDRLREWRPEVLDKINHFSCMMIRGLDIDGFRIDKAMEVTVDSQGSFSAFQRACAKSVGKDNFFIPGEIVNGNADGAIYIGRGKDPSMQIQNWTAAITSASSNESYIREDGHQALDAAAFHYSTYRALMRFLGLDGDLLAVHDAPIDFPAQWATFVQTNDLINANSGEFDPRHMYGVSNQDVLRWPGLTNGTERQLLGDFITTLLMPGIPLVSWGEEQAFYTLDSTASNYLYGRQPMSSSLAWQMHGCYKVGDINLNNAPFNSSLTACEDDGVSLDHRDPSHPVYGAMKHMFELRQRYPVLQDGWTVDELSKQVFNYTLPGSEGQPTVTGLYSVVRARLRGAQDLSREGTYGNQPVWLLYSNYNQSTVYDSDCQSDTATIAPFDEGSTVKNLFYPFDEWTLAPSNVSLGIEGSTLPNGCLPSINMTLYGWKAFVPKEQWSPPPPVITKFLPGHDSRGLSTGSAGVPSIVQFEVRFSRQMDCASFREALSVNSTTDSCEQATIDPHSIQCLTIDPQFEAYYYGPAPSIWKATGNLTNVHDGIHVLNINNVTSQDGDYTNSNDHFLLRVGTAENPMVFPRTANYSTTLLYSLSPSQSASERRGVNGSEAGLVVNHQAPGAEKWRYSLSFGAIWSPWYDYVPGNASLLGNTLPTTMDKSWPGQHIQVQYWSAAAGSSDHALQGDLATENDSAPRRVPHLFVHGDFNNFGYDQGLPHNMSQRDDGIWTFDFLTEWPTNFQLNVWGMAADGRPDLTYALGDVDFDGVLDRVSPVSLQPDVVYIDNLGPPAPALAWQIQFNDADFRYHLAPIGNRWYQALCWILLGIVPAMMATTAVWAYMHFFYGVKFNKVGLAEKRTFLPMAALKKVMSRETFNDKDSDMGSITAGTPAVGTPQVIVDGDVFAPVATVHTKRRTVLIATMEYDIADWKIKIKIGGLGVMAQLMASNLKHQDLVWVVPCVGGVRYPTDCPGEPIDVTILGRTYEVEVQYHKLKNITYMLLDAPVFRRQTSKKPYPARMDDLDSAIYYSAWNQCIAEAMNRFDVDLYHINDYHGAAAPLYILPRAIPCCLSLHNAEFQGLWPMRKPEEVEEICAVFNLPVTVVQKYVQFGEVFNLLHAGASILRIHQKGFGAVGVSKKYGKRSWARYPIFWGLKRIGALPNPDPSDIAEWDRKQASLDEIKVDSAFESERAEFKRQAQKWAGLDERADADLFVFVGRWSMQKGIDLVADVFPGILEQYEHVQLLCVGPIIDLHGKFAALKLQKMMEKYPGRVYSKPEFTALPKYIFSGAEFALIPSRDEPFGLVAVEFGRKGALGVGSRVGGLGQMPGWWYTIESATTRHHMHQFKMAIAGALKSDSQTRALMRARSAKQRFPVAQWKEDLEILQTNSIKIHKRRIDFISNRQMGLEERNGSVTPMTPGWATPRMGWMTPSGSRPSTRPSSPARSDAGSRRTSVGPSALSLGLRLGPGHMSFHSHTSSDRGSSRGASPAPYRNKSIASSSASIEARGRSLTRGGNEEEAYISAEAADESRRRLTREISMDIISEGARERMLYTPDPTITEEPPTPLSIRYAFLSRPHTPSRANSSVGSFGPLSTEQVVRNEEKKDHDQNLTPFFTDPTGLYYKTFEKRLENLSSKNSESTLCIEEYLERSEKQWFHRLHEVKMGRSASQGTTRYGDSVIGEGENHDCMEQFLLPANYAPPTGIRRLVMYKVGDWPVYTFLLALGQILAANSYQITLISGQIGQTATQLYIVAGVYLGTTLLWWYIFRRFATLWCLSLPWILYGLAFFMVAVVPFGSTAASRSSMQTVATCFYAAASSSGSLFFAQNFGSLGSVAIKDWAFRACAIQGTQQLYVVGLWAWGAKLTTMDATDTRTLLGTTMTAIGIPIAIFMWAVGIVVFLGLPDFYRQKPGAVPDFYSSIWRRKIIVWFLITVFIQNVFMSAPYGRNWSYLWSSKHAPGWAISLLVVLFFVVIWAGLLFCFGHLSITHSWIIPIFAIGLGSPRWCQMLWAISDIGQYLPWAGGPIASAMLGRSLWLWLGVLDSIQGIGFGMILLQTMVRFHCTFALMGGQVLGAIATIIARADGLNSIGPGPTFPNLAGQWSAGLSQPWFWICLICQLSISVGFFAFFRKEQLAKP